MIGGPTERFGQPVRRSSGFAVTRRSRRSPEPANPCRSRRTSPTSSPRPRPPGPSTGPSARRDRSRRRTRTPPSDGWSSHRAGRAEHDLRRATDRLRGGPDAEGSAGRDAAGGRAIGSFGLTDFLEDSDGFHDGYRLGRSQAIRARPLPGHLAFSGSEAGLCRCPRPRPRAAEEPSCHWVGCRYETGISSQRWIARPEDSHTGDPLDAHGHVVGHSF